MTPSEWPSNGNNGNYCVDLAVFQGPLDLLLFLVKKDEIDIYDIPVAKITKQYLQYIELMQSLNLEIAGEFILMAATLIRIKTRMLLPRDAEEGDEVDPREELIMALIEYKKYREASEMLRERALLEERNYVPPSPAGEFKTRVDLSPATTLFDLLAAFKDVLATRREEAFHEVASQEVSIADRIGYIIRYLGRQESATFAELFAELPRKIVAVVTFVALLELVRAQRVSVSQSVLFGELRVYRGRRFEGSPQAADIAEYSPAVERVAPL